jgi:hypothetical protein
VSPEGVGFGLVRLGEASGGDFSDGGRCLGAEAVRLEALSLFWLLGSFFVHVCGWVFVVVGCWEPLFLIV